MPAPDLELIEKPMKEFPFDTYDFFGYIASGLLVLIGLDVLFNVPDILGADIDTVKFLAITLASYIVGQMLATPAKAILEDLVVRFVLGRPSVRLMAERSMGDPRRYLFPNYFEPLRPRVQDKVRERAAEDGRPPISKQKSDGTTELVELSGEDLFVRIRFQPEIRTDETLMARMDSFLNKYGFNRNVCFASICLCIAVVLKSDEAGVDQEKFRQYAWLLGSSSVLLFYRYLKFLRLYSFEMFSAYAAGPPQDEADPQKGRKSQSP